MVLLFMITSSQNGLPYTLFFKYFHNDCKLETDSESDDDFRKKRKEKMKRVEEMLYSIYQFSITTNPRNAEADIQMLNGDVPVPELNMGHFKLYKNDPFDQDMHVIWTSVCGVILSFVCYSHENRIQAQSVLCLLVRQLFQRNILQPLEILAKPDKVYLLVTKFVPDGIIVFMNNRLIRQLERESDALFKAGTN
uniref:AP complex mu/sigma subunit domain-containing protein n=1 Tax=Biomphalaria glabrata TaxID=6526 RepID=A0A2C9KKF5_BIOGL